MIVVVVVVLVVFGQFGQRVSVSVKSVAFMTHHSCVKRVVVIYRP